VYVADHVHGVVVRLTHGATVRGRVTFATPAPVDLTAVQVMARGLGRFTSVGAEPASLAPDGAFELTGVRGVLGFTVVGGHVPGDPPVSRSLSMSVTTPQVPGGVVGSIPGGVRDVPPPPPAGATAGGVSPVTPREVSASRMVVSGGGGWRVRAVRVSGRDVTDEGLDVGQDGTLSGVEIEVARDYPLVAGVVRDARGEPLADALIVAIAADERIAKQPEGAVRPRGRSNRDGNYFVTGLPPGTWELVALAEGVPFDPFDADPRALETLRAHAVRVTLGESQRLTLDLRVLTP
jgi:hypothetical protein